MELKDISREELKQLIRDVALIKNILISEGELTDWAKKELEEARKIPDSENTSLEDIEQRILAR